MPRAILGISAYYHDSAAVLLVDGKIVAAAHEDDQDRRQGDDRTIRLLQHAAGRFRAGDERLDHIFLRSSRVADGDDILLRIHEDQPIA